MLRIGSSAGLSAPESVAPARVLVKGVTNGVIEPWLGRSPSPVQLTAQTLDAVDEREPEHQEAIRSPPPGGGQCSRSVSRSRPMAARRRGRSCVTVLATIACVVSK